jgi:hypothetical protein
MPRRGINYLGGVAKDRDPEQLLSEALRAQAVQASGPPASPGFGLLSGNDFGMAARVETTAEPPVPVATRARLHGGVILLLALILGLAAGAITGLLTVL